MRHPLIQYFLKYFPLCVCEILAAYYDLVHCLDYHGVLIMVDSKLFIFHCSQWIPLVECTNTWHIMVCKERIFRTAFSTIQEWIDMQWNTLANH